MNRAIFLRSPAGGAGATSSNSGFSTVSANHSPASGSSTSSPASGFSIGKNDIIRSYDSETNTISDKPSSFRIYVNGIPLEMHDKQILTHKNKIGGGAFSNIYKVTSTPSNVTYIIKHLTPTSKEGYSLENTEHEFDNLIQFKGNTHVIQLIAANIYNDEAYFVHEYIPGKTLHDWLRTGPTNAERERIFAELELAVKSVHEAGYVHLDLHPNNIWIPDDSSKPLFLLDLGSMHITGAKRNSVTRTARYSPGPLSPINLKNATIAINDFAMNVLKRNIVPHKVGGNRKSRTKRLTHKKHKKHTRKANRK